MKKPVMKALSITLCALLGLSGLGGAAYAMNAAGDPAPVEPAPVGDSGGAASSGEKNFKDETVYVLAAADGSVDKIIVSDWVKNARGDDLLSDVTCLTGIENVKGDESCTLGGDNTCVWDARGRDIYYQGGTDRELPVSVAVSYTLDGAPISPEELAGRSGRVTIRFDYTNHQYELVEIGGKRERICVPFAMLSGVVLDNDVFSNVSVSNGRIVNDGERTIVAGLAFPGLQDSLGLDKDTLDLPGHVEIAADAEGFRLESTVTLAANGLLDGGADRAGDHDGLEDLDGRLDELTQAMEQLIDGSSRLYDGLCVLLDRSNELAAGIDKLAAGAARLQQGADGLSAGADQVQAGCAALRQGLDQLAGQNEALNGGAAQVFQSLLRSADAQLKAAGVQAPELTADNYAQVLEGVVASAGGSPAGQQAAALKASLDSYDGFCQGLRQYTAGVAQAQAGAAELDGGVGALKRGADGLSAGAGELCGGILTVKDSSPALTGGVAQLRDGAMERNRGLRELDEKGVQQLADAPGGGLPDRLEAVKAVSEGYTSFSGIGGDMDGRVRFIWRTQAVEARD